MNIKPAPAAVEAAKNIRDDDLKIVVRSNMRSSLIRSRERIIRHIYVRAAVLTVVALTTAIERPVLGMVLLILGAVVSLAPLGGFTRAAMNPATNSENPALAAEARKSLTFPTVIGIGAIVAPLIFALTMIGAPGPGSPATVVDYGTPSPASLTAGSLEVAILVLAVYGGLLLVGTHRGLRKATDFLRAERSGEDAEIVEQFEALIDDQLHAIKGTSRRLSGAVVDSGMRDKRNIAQIEQSIIAFDRNPVDFRADVIAFRDPLTHKPLQIAGLFEPRAAFAASADTPSAPETGSPEHAARAAAYREVAGLPPIATPPTASVTHQATTDIFGDPAVVSTPAATPAHPIEIGDVAIPIDAETSHIMVSGGSGSGKTGALLSMMADVRARGQRAVVYDPSGGFVSRFYRPGIDHILNPLDARGESWSPWADASLDHEYENIASALIPDAGTSKDSFWTEAPRAILVALLKHCRGDIEDLLRLALAAPQAELRQVIIDEGLEGAVGSSDTFANVRTSLSAYFKAMRYLKSPEDGMVFSLKNFVADTQSDSWLFITSRADARVALKPLISMWLDILVQAVMMLDEDPTKARRTWLFLDELASLQRIPSLAPALTEGRKYGLACVIGFQGVGQPLALYGRDLGHVLIGQPVSRLILRAQDAETAEYLSKEIGDVRVERTSHSTTSAPNPQAGNGIGSATNDSYGSSTQVVTERAILPSDIQNLPNFTGFFRTQGTSIRRVALKHIDLPATQPGSVSVTGA